MKYARVFVITAALLAYAPVGARAAEQTDTAKDDAAKAQSGPRKDPKGVTGISPYTEKLNEATAAFLAHDYAKASGLYRQAIEMSPNKPLGHYLLGESLLAEGKLDDAGKAWQDAVRFSKDEPLVHAKALFMLADLAERKHQWAEAAAGWKQYAAYISAVQQAKGYPDTPAKRQQAYEKHQQLLTQYAKVKERIAQREADAAAKAKKR